MTQAEEQTEPTVGQKHRTVGISMNPAFEQRAKARAEALGLKFSPYVTLCVEAELKGFSQIVRDDSLDLESALRRAREYMGQKTNSIDFEDDVENVIKASSPRISSQRFARVSGLRVDFLLTLKAASGKAERKVAVECRYNVKQYYALALGQGLLLRSSSEIEAVVLVVPYLQGFDTAVMEQFKVHGIHAATPDTLGALLRQL